jgi:rubrerythrin
MNKNCVPADIDWNLYEPNKLSKLNGDVIKMASAIEFSSLPSGAQLLRMIPEDDIDLQSFIVKWVHDENKHSYILREYCARNLPDSEILVEELKDVSEDMGSLETSIGEILVAHMCTELSTIRWYTKMCSWFEEPLMIDILKRIMVDESNHALGFKLFLKKHINKDNIKSIVSTIQMFMLKDNFISIKIPTSPNLQKSTIISRLPEPELFNYFIDHVLKFGDEDKAKLNKTLLKVASELFDQKFEDVSDLSKFRKSL